MSICICTVRQYSKTLAASETMTSHVDGHVGSSPLMRFDLREAIFVEAIRGVR